MYLCVINFVQEQYYCKYILDVKVWVLYDENVLMFLSVSSKAFQERKCMGKITLNSERYISWNGLWTNFFKVVLYLESYE